MQPNQVHPKSNIENIVIDDVNKNAWTYIKSKYGVWLGLAGLAAIFYYWGAFYLFSKFGANSGSSDGRGLGAVLSVPIIIFLAWYGGIISKFEDQFLSQFAKANGFGFSKTGQVDELYGTIFRMKGAQNVSDIITGSYSGLPLRIFLYQLTVGSGRNQQTWQDTVFEIDFSAKLPSLILSKKVHLDSGLDVAGDFNGKKLELEGDFNNDFDLLVPAGLQVEALQVFTPDVMQVLQSLKSDFRAIELSGNRVYIYVSGYINKSSALQSAFSLAKTLINKLSLVANDFKIDPSISPDPAELPAAASKSHITLEIIMLALFILIIFGMCVAVGIAGSINSSP